MKAIMREHVRKKAGCYVTGLIMALLVVAGVFAWRFWDWLRVGSSGYESGAATVRNLGFLVAATIALPLGIWRSFVADRQSRTAQQGLLNERYQKSAEMLGSGVLSVRLGGIYALQRLAEEHPDQYHVQIMRLFSAFVRNPTKDSEEKAEKIGPPDAEAKPAPPRPDIQAIMEAIRDRSERGAALEKEGGFRWNFESINLSGLLLNNADLSEAWFKRANLSNTWLDGSNLSRANLKEANLVDAQLLGANLSNANLEEANLSAAFFDRANMSNTQLEKAKAPKAHFHKANLSGAILEEANLSSAWLGEANLTDVKLNEADLFNAQFLKANLSGANLSEAKLTNANLAGATGLTQAQIAQARFFPSPSFSPFIPDDTLDAETGEPLIWRVRPPADK